MVTNRLQADQAYSRVQRALCKKPQCVASIRNRQVSCTAGATHFVHSYLPEQTMESCRSRGCCNFTCCSPLLLAVHVQALLTPALHVNALYASTLHKAGHAMQGAGQLEAEADLFAARLDQEQGVPNATGHLMCFHAFQSMHLVRVSAALLPIRTIP